MEQKTAGNDTFAGVWEMMGVVYKKRFKSNTTGFSGAVLKLVEKRIGIGVVGNEYISGFLALDKYYIEHRKTRKPIMYLGDDGVVLLAAHESIIDPDKLNIYGSKLIKILTKYGVSRVITRPFVGKPGRFKRTKKRQDYIIKPESKTSLVGRLQKQPIEFIVTEHISRLLGGRKNKKIISGNLNNKETLTALKKCMYKSSSPTFLMAVLQDFDMCGHKKDINGYAKSLIYFDSKLPKIISMLKNDDLLVITADHGCDPTLNLRGHTREYVPLIFYSKKLKISKWVGKRSSFADLGQTICFNFNMPLLKNGNVVYEIF
jgi:phosphopentomutase